MTVCLSCRHWLTHLPAALLALFGLVASRKAVAPGEGGTPVSGPPDFPAGTLIARISAASNRTTYSYGFGDIPRSFY